jgi:hypothetical protein
MDPHGTLLGVMTTDIAPQPDRAAAMSEPARAEAREP